MLNQIWISLSDVQVIPLLGSVDRQFFWVRGSLLTGATGGVFSMQWAQNGASLTATVLLAGSWLRLSRIEA